MYLFGYNSGNNSQRSRVNLKITAKTATILLFVSLAGLPLFATSNYTISETEGGVRTNPLHLLKESPGSDTVNRHAPKKEKHSKRNALQKVIYLTFDDGPGKGTANVLNALKEEGVEGTMFFIGSKIEHQP